MAMHRPVPVTAGAGAGDTEAGRLSLLLPTLLSAGRAGPGESGRAGPLSFLRWLPLVLTYARCRSAIQKGHVPVTPVPVIVLVAMSQYSAGMAVSGLSDGTMPVATPAVGRWLAPSK